MNFPRKFQFLFTYEGIVFTLIFTLLFSTAHLTAIDFGGLGNVVKNDMPLYILIFTAIFIYLQCNSKVVFTAVKAGFYIIWLLYILTIFINDFSAGEFSWTKIAVYILISLIFLYNIPSELPVFLMSGGIISGFILLGGTEGSGVSIAAALILSSGLLLLPKENQAFLFYLLPAVSVILIIPFSSTALITMGGTFLSYFVLINISATGRYIAPVTVTITAVIIFTVNFIYQNFILQKSIYTVFDSILVTNGVITLILFIFLLIYTAAISVPFSAASYISLYLIAFSNLLVYEPVFFSNIVIFTPSVMLILLLSIILSNKHKSDYRL